MARERKLHNNSQQQLNASFSHHRLQRSYTLLLCPSEKCFFRPPSWPLSSSPLLLSRAASFYAQRMMIHKKEQWSWWRRNKNIRNCIYIISCAAKLILTLHVSCFSTHNHIISGSHVLLVVVFFSEKTLQGIACNLLILLLSCVLLLIIKEKSFSEASA